MASINYQKRLINLQNRKFDSDLRESALTKSFSTSSLPENIKYLVESMQPIDRKYNSKTLTAAENVQTHLERDLDLHFGRVYKNQGSVTTGTNIKVHSDIDLLTIINRYHFPQGISPNPYTASDPYEDIKELRKQAVQVLKRQYDIVDNTGEKNFFIINKNLDRKVDIVPCFWYESDKYKETNDEHYKGIYLFDFKSETKHRDFPFATINNSNHKGDATNDGFRRGVRLLKTLSADCDVEIKTLKSFQLTSIAYSIDNGLLMYQRGSELQIAQQLSNAMSRMIEDPTYRQSILSPNGTEFPLLSSTTVPDLKRLKEDLDQLILDSSEDVGRSLSVRTNILSY